MGRRTVLRAAAAAALGTLGPLGVACPALAQVDGAVDPGRAEVLQREARLRELQELELDNRLRANRDVPVGQRVLVDYGGFVSANYLSLDDPEGENHILWQYELVGYARVNFDGAHELFLRGRVGWRDFHEGDDFDGRGDERIDPDLDRGYYRFDLRRHMAAYQGTQIDYDLTVQGGRDFVYWANGLVLAQALDGVIVDFGNERLNLDVIAGVTPVRTVDFDASRPDFDFNTRRGFYGGMLTATAGDHRPFVYGLIQRDYNEDETLVIATTRTDFNYDSYYLGVGSVGSIGDRLRYGVEFAYEFGDSLSNSFTVLSGGGLAPVEQTEDDIRAWAFDFKLDYLVNDPFQTRLSAEAILASGDDDRGQTSNTFNGNETGTDDEAFNAFGLLNTGLAFAPEVSNIMALRLGAATFPLPDAGAFRRMQLGADVFVFGKLDRDAPIDETTGTERYLGWEPDVYLNWQITSDVTLALRYGVFFPSEDNFLDDDSRQFFFAGVTFGY